MPELSDKERTRRQNEVDFARGNVELSGLVLSPEVIAFNELYVADEIFSDELTQQVIAHADTLPIAARQR